ncbi:MAG: hypothetical protein J6K73_02430 [Clostridia bacterium]|nr:hypothetical protein [Clostridia bacterium]
MRDYCLLLGLTLRNRLAALRLGSWRKDNGKIDVGRIAATIVAVLSLGLLAGLIIFAEVKLFNILKTLRQDTLLPGVAMLLSMASTLLLSFFHVLSALYFSKDTIWLSYLPVRSRSAMAAKMTEVWLSEDLFSAAILLPLFVLYGIHVQADVLYYVRMVTIVLMAPMIPLAFIGLLTSLLARSTSLARNKEALSVILSVVMIAVILGLEGTVLPKIPDDADAMFFVRMLLDNEGILTMLTSAFPPVLWAVHGVQGNWAEYGLFALCSLGSAALLLLLLGKDYLNVCLKQGEHATRKRKIKTGGKTWKQRSPLMAMFIKEWNAVIKNPTVAFNSLPSIFMFPLIVVMGGVGASSAMDVNTLLEELRGLVAQLSPFDLALILTAAVSFAAFVNPAVATAVSREGSRLEISKMIPVSARTQMTAKLLVGMLIDFLAVGVAVVMLAFLLPGQWLVLAMVFVLSMLLCYAMSAVNLTLDAVRPNLHWTNEAQVVKQGANVVFGMLIGLVMFALPVIPPFLLLNSTPVWRFAASAGVLVLEAVVGFMLIRLVAEKRFAALEPGA